MYENISEHDWLNYVDLCSRTFSDTSIFKRNKVVRTIFLSQKIKTKYVRELSLIYSKVKCMRESSLNYIFKEKILKHTLFCTFMIV